MRTNGDGRDKRGIDPRGRLAKIERNEPLKRGKPPKRRKRLKRESDKHEAQRDERAHVVAVVFKRAGGRCQARERVGGDCSGPLDTHEVVPRSVWPLGYLEPDNCVLVCRAHHDWIGDNPQAAHDVGLHRFSWERR